EIPELAERPATALTMLCERSATIRANVARLSYYAPLYLEIATCEGYTSRSERFWYAAWLFVNPAAAKIAALRHLSYLPFPWILTEGFPDSLIRREQLQETLAGTFEVQAA